MRRLPSTLLAVLLASACGGSSNPADAGVEPPDAAGEGDAGSVDAAGSFDAAPDAPPVSLLPDVTGEFLLALSVNVSPATPLQFRMENFLTQRVDGTGVLDVRMTPLTVADRVPVGDPVVVKDVVVAVTGDFSLMAYDVLVPGAANPITGSDLVVDMILNGRIQTPDLLCGDLAGMVTSPVVLDLSPGSTFAAIRVTPGATGAQLPEPVSSCFAAVPDAGI